MRFDHSVIYVLGLLACLQNTACTGEERFLAVAHQSKIDKTPATGATTKPPNGPRPSEEGETIPGYLVAVDHIKVTFVENQYSIKAPEGTVVATNSHELMDLEVRVYQGIDTEQRAENPEDFLKGRLAVQENGSFEGHLTLNGRDPIILLVTEKDSEVKYPTLPLGTDPGRVTAVKIENEQGRSGTDEPEVLPPSDPDEQPATPEVQRPGDLQEIAVVDFKMRLKFESPEQLYKTCLKAMERRIPGEKDYEFYFAFNCCEQQILEEPLCSNLENQRET